MTEWFENVALISLSILSVIISIYLGISLAEDIIEMIRKGKHE